MIGPAFIFKFYVSSKTQKKEILKKIYILNSEDFLNDI